MPANHTFRMLESRGVGRHQNPTGASGCQERRFLRGACSSLAAGPGIWKTVPDAAA